ncbi:FAD-binding domain-containing protein [Pholiota conissans]|uniref:FAD-binding domain-containing protein n=1 Tax=Pholiota conissans TaxID=109636 RepID=A0A9P5YRM1_9AGAR|nr:FAD-binding domain-containing protein [Pholiota conissans]
MKAFLWSSCFVSLCLSFAFAGTAQPERKSFPDAICVQIAHSISSASEVFYPGDPLYDKGIYHYSAWSSQKSKCVVEAGSPQDVGKILFILGRTKTPFAVKGGGHATNPGFSSSPGVLISMYRFSEITYHAASNTADIGVGLICDDVYATLDPLGVTVLGGRVTGLGIAGFTLGGGYSWKTNEYGLGVDNVVAFQLVQPNGRIVTVTKTSDPELFFGLTGGFNNFGVVTRLTLRTFPQGQVWGGSITLDGSTMPAVKAATTEFQASTDPKGGLIASYGYVTAAEQVVVSLLIFYDAPTPPPGLFDAFLAIPALQSDISTRSYLSLVQSQDVNSTSGLRIMFEAVPIISFTPELSDILLNETIFWGQKLASKSAVALGVSSEIFLPSIYSHNAAKTAFPPVRNIPFQPFVLGYAWDSAEFDADFIRAIHESAAYIHKAAIALGQTALRNAPVYPNYAAIGTPLKDMYGANLPALRALRRRVDPAGVMALTGGWKF